MAYRSFPITDDTVTFTPARKNSGFVLIGFFDAAGAAVLPSGGSVTFSAVDALGITHPFTDPTVQANDVNPSNATYVVPSWGSPLTKINIAILGIAGDATELRVIDQGDVV